MSSSGANIKSKRHVSTLSFNIKMCNMDWYAISANKTNMILPRLPDMLAILIFLSVPIAIA
jgi:hypothetical protein